MPDTHRVMAKVVLVGDKAVGKTSLIRRYVTDQFDDRYLLTLGAKVTKKAEPVRVPEKGVDVSVELNVWDIMGQTGFRELLKEAYFHGARGILAVVDLTRKSTLEGIPDWVKAVHDITGPVPMVLLANKSDLTAQAAVTPGQIAAAASALKCPSFSTSAKTGENVEAAFRNLASQIVRAYVVR
ncbi:MAG TPA: Rab family GTPase [Thermoplasmata archaeon]|nr:Rab family GTPase [Thermoplasmata archaeon]